MVRQPHLFVEPGDVHDIALVPGNPDRIDRIVERCENVESLARNREYRLVNAEYGGVPLTVCSTGIGSPSAAIAAEELANVGVETLLRVGTIGALQPGIEVGDLVVATGAAKNEGTTRRYEAVEYPAVPSHDLVGTLVEAAEAGEGTVHVGPIVTDDAYYAEDDEAVADWSEAGLLAVEMEAAALFTLARRRGLRAGAVCAVDGNLVTGTQKGAEGHEGETPDEELSPAALDGEGRAIRAALEAAAALG